MSRSYKTIKNKNKKINKRRHTYRTKNKNCRTKRKYGGKNKFTDGIGDAYKKIKSNFKKNFTLKKKGDPDYSSINFNKIKSALRFSKTKKNIANWKKNKIKHFKSSNDKVNELELNKKNENLGLMNAQLIKPNNDQLIEKNNDMNDQKEELNLVNELNQENKELNIQNKSNKILNEKLQKEKQKLQEEKQNLQEEKQKLQKEKINLCNKKRQQKQNLEEEKQVLQEEKTNLRKQNENFRENVEKQIANQHEQIKNLTNKNEDKAGLIKTLNAENKRLQSELSRVFNKSLQIN